MLMYVNDHDVTQFTESVSEHVQKTILQMVHKVFTKAHNKFRPSLRPFSRNYKQQHRSAARHDPAPNKQPLYKLAGINVLQRI